jgi:hypothetical protein
MLMLPILRLPIWIFLPAVKNLNSFTVLCGGVSAKRGSTLKGTHKFMTLLSDKVRQRSQVRLQGSRECISYFEATFLAYTLVILCNQAEWLKL